MNYYNDFVEYIINNYLNARKIVEVGAGKNLAVYRELKRKLKGEIIATDLAGGEDIVKDDVSVPDMRIYEGAELIYSIRPPPELYNLLKNIAVKVNSDLVIIPFYPDEVNLEEAELINYRRAFFYFIKRI